MIKITSKSNEKIKLINSLKDKKGRKEQKAYLVEGVKMVKEAITLKQDIRLIIGLEELISNLEFNGEKIIADKNVLDYISDCETSQNVFAVINVQENSTEIGDKCVLLDRVRDPGNLGTIIRTSVAVGVKDIFLFDCVDCYSPKVVRASMSGIYNVRLRTVTSEQVIELSKKLPFICADMNGENIFTTKKIDKFCLCMGNEANGLSQQVISLGKNNLKIPMKNEIESLNVAVSYAIIIYNLIYNG